MVVAQSCSPSPEGKSPRESISITITDALSSCLGSFCSTRPFYFILMLGSECPINTRKVESFVYVAHTRRHIQFSDGL